MIEEPLLVATGKVLTCIVLPAGADAFHACAAAPDAVAV